MQYKPHPKLHPLHHHYVIKSTRPSPLSMCIIEKADVALRQGDMSTLVYAEHSLVGSTIPKSYS